MDDNTQSTQPFTNDAPQPEPQDTPKPKPNYAFYTPSEMGIKTTPADLPDPIIPKPGMTFTPTGGSVSNIQHVHDPMQKSQNDSIITPDSTT